MTSIGFFPKGVIYISISKTTKCLTEKPHGIFNPGYNYMKNRISNMKIEYKNCDNYRCKTNTLNGYTAKPLINNNLSTFKNEDYIFIRNKIGIIGSILSNYLIKLK